jgi:hypothetical protein
MAPDEFKRQLLEAGKQHKRIGVIKFWSMCCVQCSSRPPVAIVLTELSDAQLIAAHGMSCKRTVVLLSRVLPKDHGIFLSIKRIIPKDQVDVETAAYAKKLADLYVQHTLPYQHWKRHTSHIQGPRGVQGCITGRSVCSVASYC